MVRGGVGCRRAQGRPARVRGRGKEKERGGEREREFYFRSFLEKCERVRKKKKKGRKRKEDFNLTPFSSTLSHTNKQHDESHSKQGNLLLWSGVFYGLTQFRVHYAVPGPRRLRPGWAFYLSLGQTLAWLLASHVLSRMPPVELVQAWTGGIAAAAAAAAPAAAAAATTAAAGSSNGGEGSSSAAPAAAAAAPAAAPERASSSVKLRPILGKLPSSLRESLGKVPGVEIV